jgi:hypothetical protein
MCAFLQIKAERLLVPLVIVGMLYILLQNVTPGVNNRPPSLPFVYPFAHFWFLGSVYLLAVLDRVGLLACKYGGISCVSRRLGLRLHPFADRGQNWLRRGNVSSALSARRA